MSSPEEDAFETHAERVLRASQQPYGPRQLLPRTVGALQRRRAMLREATARLAVERARVRTCVCGTVFQGASTRAVYCTRICEGRAWARARGYVSGPRDIECQECGTPFAARRSDARYCGDTCRRLADAKRKRRVRNERGGSHR